MKYSEARAGRIFILRLEDGDIVHESIETFAREKKINAASVIILGGADSGSVLTVGPEKGRTNPVVPMHHTLDDVYEVSGTGTIFPDSSGAPMLHMHMALGRKADAVAGCVRSGVRVWHVMEVVIQEIVETTARRQMDAATGFKLMVP